jgi:helix-turn-helix protein
MLDELGPRLHDRVTRGQSLTQEEARTLEAWYAQLDQAELAQIVRMPEQNLTLLQQQIDASLAQLAITTKQIRRLARENAALRHENAHLRVRLVEQAILQPV